MDLEDTVPLPPRYSILDEENGRKYHTFHAGKYLQPCDELEECLLDAQHDLFKIKLDDKLLTAPVQSSWIQVLDVGTGTGTWAIEFAQRNLDAKVYGTDLAPIQPKYVPPNLQFILDDCDDRPWHSTSLYDVIHIRNGFTFSKRAHFDAAMESLKPGGFLELQDIVFPFHSKKPGFEQTAMAKWGRLLVKEAKTYGNDWESANKASTYMKDAGFVHLCETTLECPIGTWDSLQPAEEGDLCLWIVRNWISSLSLACLTRSGFTRLEVEMLLKEVEHELETPRELQAVMSIKVIYGQKPLKIVSNPKERKFDFINDGLRPVKKAKQSLPGISNSTTIQEPASDMDSRIIVDAGCNSGKIDQASKLFHIGHSHRQASKICTYGARHKLSDKVKQLECLKTHLIAQHLEGCLYFCEKCKNGYNNTRHTCGPEQPQKNIPAYWPGKRKCRSRDCQKTFGIPGKRVVNQADIQKIHSQYKDHVIEKHLNDDNHGIWCRGLSLRVKGIHQRDQSDLDSFFRPFGHTGLDMASAMVYFTTQKQMNDAFFAFDTHFNGRLTIEKVYI